MATIGTGALVAGGVFAKVPYVGWAVGLAAAYVDSQMIYPALMDNPEEARLPQLASLPTSEQGPGAPRTFAFGARIRVPAHCMYQSSKAREDGSGGGSKGGTNVALRRVFVNALIHLNDRPSSRLLQLIGNGQLILYNDRNLIGVTSENLSADVSGSDVIVSLADRFDPDFRDTFKVGDLLIPSDFVRVAGPTTWNGTYYAVTAVTAATLTAGSTVTVVPADGQSVTSLEYTGGTAFSPASVKRVDNALGGSGVTFTARQSGVSYLHLIKNPGFRNPGDIFKEGDIVRVRNLNLAAVGGTNGDVVGRIRRIQDGGATAQLDTRSPYGPDPLSSGTNVAVSALSGTTIIAQFDDDTNFTSGVFPEDYDPIYHYSVGTEDQAEPRILVQDFGSGQSSHYRGMASQGLDECFVSAFGDQLPTNLEAILEIDDNLAWSQAVEMVLQRGDLRNTQIDVSSITPRPFRGSYVRGVVPVLQQLQPLLVAGQLLPQDRNGVVCMFDVDNADSVQIENGATFTDIGTRMYGERSNTDKVQMEDKPQSDMPTSIGVRFQDPDNAFTIGYEHFGLRNPEGVDHVNEQIMDLSSMVLSRREARNLATTLMRRAWVNRRTYRMSLPAAYLHLLENDLITWTDETGEAVVARIIQRDIGANYVVNVTALREMTNLSVAGSPVQSSATVVPQQTVTTALLLTVAFDAPGIANTEVPPSAGQAIRLSVADLSGTMSTATVYESVDNATYTPVGTVGSSAALGILTTNLSAQDASEEYGTTTVSLRSQTVDVLWFNTGPDTIEACTQAEAEAGKNWCAIADATNDEVEIAAFTTVTVNADGSYTLGGWLRGLRGTASVQQNASAYITLLNQSTGGLFWRELPGATPSTLSYKVVPAGGELATTTPVTGSPTFVNALPLPIREVTKTYSATTGTRFDVAEHWTRQVLPLGTQPPHALDEPFEAYRVNIYQQGSTDIIADTYIMDARWTGGTLRDTYFDYTDARATAAGYTPGPTETYYISYQQIGLYGDGPLRFETI